MDPFGELLSTDEGSVKYLTYCNQKHFFPKYAEMFVEFMDHRNMHIDMEAPFDPWIPVPSVVCAINMKLPPESSASLYGSGWQA